MQVWQLQEPFWQSLLACQNFTEDLENLDLDSEDFPETLKY